MDPQKAHIGQADVFRCAVAFPVVGQAFVQVFQGFWGLGADIQLQIMFI